jgi:hypothetical protein
MVEQLGLCWVTMEEHLCIERLALDVGVLAEQSPCLTAGGLIRIAGEWVTR